MRNRGGIKEEHASEASWEAARGAAAGAARWGLYSAVLAGAGYALSPLYRGLTIQFKVYIFMSGMIMGSMLEADQRVRDYEARVRMQARVIRDRAAWESYEKEFEESPKQDKPAGRT